jgi:hypothetical protein
MILTILFLLLIVAVTAVPIKGIVETVKDKEYDWTLIFVICLLGWLLLCGFILTLISA